MRDGSRSRSKKINVVGDKPEPQEQIAEGAPKKPVIYTLEALDRELRQAEIIANLAQFFFDPVTKEVDSIRHPFVVVLTQDCDLLWDYTSRNSGGGQALASVLLYVADPTAEVQRSIDRDIWRRVIKNNNERYHLLENVSPECDATAEGIPSLIIDFKSFFTLSPQDIYAQCANGTASRRCRLEVPYREHLQCRAAFYFQRVTLPTPHEYVS